LQANLAYELPAPPIIASIQMGNNVNWFEDYADDEEDFEIDEYDITATPNDFNVTTLFSFIESGAVRIPGFQRNFVWDQVRASKLIESLILGIPVPQLFLYEQARNKFLVIDGQQRLLSIYYFKKRRFPRKEKRVELRHIFDENGGIPELVLFDDEYFIDFRLKFAENLPNRKNKFTGLNYSTLGDYQTQFDLRPIRNIIVKQNSPKDDDSSIYELFNRLNTGGINLRPQEIRTSMYHSDFYDILYKINLNVHWRQLTGTDTPDIHMKDIEILLRGFAMLIDGANYAPSLVRFLNQFSRKCEKQTTTQNTYLQQLFESFLTACNQLPEDVFVNAKNNRFNIALFEAVFTATCKQAFEENRLVSGSVSMYQVKELEVDPEFLAAASQSTTRKINVTKRLERATSLLTAL
jgi:uncharacterized protein with ParB-like and HNH nuclease domain